MQGASLAAQGVYIGTSSWKYPGWCGTLYDPARYEYLAGSLPIVRFMRRITSVGRPKGTQPSGLSFHQLQRKRIAIAGSLRGFDGGDDRQDQGTDSDNDQ